MTTQQTPSAGALAAAKLIHPYTIDSRYGSSWKVDEMAQAIDREAVKPAVAELVTTLAATRKALRAAMDRMESAGMRYICATPEYTEPLEQARVIIAKHGGAS